MTQGETFDGTTSSFIKLFNENKVSCFHYEARRFSWFRSSKAFRWVIYLYALSLIITIGSKWFYVYLQRRIQTQNDSGQRLWAPKKMSPKNDQEAYFLF